MGRKRKSQLALDESTALEGASGVSAEKVNTTEHAKSVSSTSGNKQNANKSLSKGKQASQRLSARKYSLRSSQVSARVLRSGSKDVNKTAPFSSISPVNSIPGSARGLRSRSKDTSKSASASSNPPVILKPGRKKRKRRRKSSLNDEFSSIRKRVRYLLTRMNYEQSLIEAYSAEGWKGLSLEKIRPEKELERAKSEILRCKLRIRDSFKRLDESLAVGRFEESLFDSEGQIDCEDIFCAKCSSKDVSPNNDIILCDGNCDRGFHQNCLNPPLLTAEIPPEDQGWLCPACDCKADCIKLLSEFQTTRISIEDSWEKVFPEAAAIANGGKQFDDSGYPSDDSEDNDFDPDLPEADTDDQMDGSSSDESDSVSLSQESVPLNQNNTYDDLGLPSEDSEDDDFDPAGPESLDHQKDTIKESTSDESDFTSDSDEFCAEISKLAGNGDAVTSSLLENKPLDNSGEKRSTKGNEQLNSELQSILQLDPGKENALPVHGKRQHERFDHKKLYDETYGKTSSDSSDDEEWSEMAMPEKVNKADNNQECAALEARSQAITTWKSPRNVQDKLKSDDFERQSNLDKKEGPQTFDITQNSVNPNLTLENGNAFTPISSGNKATTHHKLSREVSQKLRDFFKVNQYPSREMKERLSEELGLPFERISRWFNTARHNMKVSAKSDIPGSYVSLSGLENNHLEDPTRERISTSTLMNSISSSVEESTPKRVTTTSQMNTNVIPTLDSTPKRMTTAVQINTNISQSLEDSTPKRITTSAQLNPNIIPSPEYTTPKGITITTQFNTNISPSDNGVAQVPISSESKKRSNARTNAWVVNEQSNFKIEESTETPESKRKKAIERELRKRRLCR